MVSSAHAVCSKGLYIAMVSTTIETDKPELEIKPALEVLGDVLEMFVSITTLYEPTDNGKKDNVSLFFVVDDLNDIVVCDKELRCYIPL